MAYAVLLCLGLFLSGHSRVTVAEPSATEHESCKVWDKIADQLTLATGAQQQCWSNGTDPCTRIDCSGAYEYNNKNSFFHLPKNIEVDYCFGIILNHCDKNISLDFYMQVPEKNVDRTTRVYHNTLLSIPGLSYTIGASASAQGYLYFEMIRQQDLVTFSVTVKVRVTISGMEAWPGTLQRQLISNETVPVPPCSPGSSDPTSPYPALGKCHPPTWKKEASSGIAYKGDFGKLCSETKYCSNDPWLACNVTSNRCACTPEFETVNNSCRPIIQHGNPCRSDGDCSLQMSERCWQGKCECQEGDKFNPRTQTCEKDNGKNVPTVVSTSAPHVAEPTEKKQNKTVVIVCAVVGGLVVLAGILLASYFAIRRLRRPYHNRELLLEGEDNDGIM